MITGEGSRHDDARSPGRGSLKFTAAPSRKPVMRNGGYFGHSQASLVHNFYVEGPANSDVTIDIGGALSLHNNATQYSTTFQILFTVSTPTGNLVDAFGNRNAPNSGALATLVTMPLNQTFTVAADTYIGVEILEWSGRGSDIECQGGSSLCPTCGGRSGSASESANAAFAIDPGQPDAGQYQLIAPDGISLSATEIPEPGGRPTPLNACFFSVITVLSGQAARGRLRAKPFFFSHGVGRYAP